MVSQTRKFGNSFLNLLFESAFRRGNCKKASVGLLCEIGLRCRTYYVLCGSVLSVWNELEEVLSPVSGSNVKVQIVRLRTEDGQRIVGKLTCFPNFNWERLTKISFLPRNARFSLTNIFELQLTIILVIDYSDDSPINRIKEKRTRADFTLNHITYFIQY